MRTKHFVLAGVALVLSASTAFADKVEGVYEVKYEEVSTNCQSPLKYPHGKMTIKATKGSGISVDIDRTPLMQGSVSGGTKISAKSKKGATSLDGMDGVFSVAGKISPEGMLTLVMVGEYSASGKALCSQSWNVVGSKADTAPQKPVKKAASFELVPSLLSLD